eukprot:jgi/Psemu1/60630/gm1.60630_g
MNQRIHRSTAARNQQINSNNSNNGNSNNNNNSNSNSNSNTPRQQRQRIVGIESLLLLQRQFFSSSSSFATCLSLSSSNNNTNVGIGRNNSHTGNNRNNRNESDTATNCQLRSNTSIRHIHLTQFNYSPTTPGPQQNNVGNNGHSNSSNNVGHSNSNSNSQIVGNSNNNVGYSNSSDRETTLATAATAATATATIGNNVGHSNSSNNGGHSNSIDRRQCRRPIKVPSAISDKKPDNDASKKQTPWERTRTKTKTRTRPPRSSKAALQDLKTRSFTMKLLNNIGKKYSMSEATSIKTGKLTLIGITKPDAIEDKKVFKALHFYKQEEWKLDMKRYNETKFLVNRNLSLCYALIWGQLTITLRNKVKADPDYVTAMTNKDAIELFKIVTKICNKTSTLDHEPTTVVSSLYSIISLYGGNMPRGFDPTTTMIENYLTYRSLAMHGGNKSNAEHVAYVKDIKIHTTDQFFTIMFLKQSGERFEECRRSLNNNYTKGTNHIPATIDGAYALLQNYETPEKRGMSQKKKYNGNKKESTNGTDNNSNQDLPKTAHTFQQDNQSKSTQNPTKDFQQHDKISTNKTITCYKCGREGHISPQCTQSTTIDGDTIEAESESRPYRPKKSGTTHVHFEDETERVSLGDFDFEDELEQDGYFH